MFLFWSEWYCIPSGVKETTATPIGALYKHKHIQEHRSSLGFLNYNPKCLSEQYRRAIDTYELPTCLRQSSRQRPLHFLRQRPNSCAMHGQRVEPTFLCPAAPEFLCQQGKCSSTFRAISTHIQYNYIYPAPPTPNSIFHISDSP